ncbi:MAG: phosphate/phosphite/phosphonate ABC transporter substrate-binding protein [Nitrospiraceae bacterium]|nr:MAG: phosphate/phosphite/phosphonate ABC transporter substrate-binding protein [Nitrospiraceae bacterium]
MFPAMNVKALRPFLILVCLFFLISLGCVKEEKPKKVTLRQKTVGTGTEIEYPRKDTLWFGFDLRLGPKEDVMIYIPFLKYLEKATGMRFRIKFTERYEDTVQNLGSGVTQFAAIGALSYAAGEAEYGISYLVSGVNKDGSPTYHSVIFTRPESGIRDLKDLKGRCFAFGSRMSTQGHIIPRKMLEDEGVTLRDMGKHIYTGSHLDTLKEVLNGECDAGGIQDTLAERMASEGKIRILKTSGPYPGSLIAYSSAVDVKTVEAVKAALLALEPMGKHKGILFDWDKTEMPLGFMEVDQPELDKVKTLARNYGLLKGN